MHARSHPAAPKTMNYLALTLSLLAALMHYCRAYPLDCPVEPFDLPWVTLEEVDIIGDAVTIVPDCTVPYLKFKWTARGGSQDMFQPLYRCTWNSSEISSSIDVSFLPSKGSVEVPFSNPSVALPFGTECTFGGCYHNGYFKIYHVQPVTCTIDIDECSAGLDNCDSNADCNNTVGGFECTCQHGYTGDGTYCQDVDECSDGRHNCSENANCSNTEGGFLCHCQTGFAGDGFNCTNVDECLAIDNPCGPDPLAGCIDTEGSFACVCAEGYEWTGVLCQDISECLEGLHDCHRNAECINTVGGYTCSCKTGFDGDGHSCDIGLCVQVMVVGLLLIGLAAVVTIVAVCCVLSSARCYVSRRWKDEYYRSPGSLTSLEKAEDAMKDEGSEGTWGEERGVVPT